MAHLQILQIIPASRFDVFDYLVNPANLPFLLQPAIDVQVVTPEIELKRGVEVHFNMTRFGLTQSIRFRIEDVLRGSRLTYRQSEGVFAAWTHTMKFEDHGAGGALVTDIVDYQVPMGLFGFLADDLFVKTDMRRLLTDRLKKAAEHFESIG
ncbi:MAG: hypothetical protein HC902_05255 [Calothrix sp. SM1_5_4]|nr:hypothetical protein [Calothrix sp. SM1_5_4]